MDYNYMQTPLSKSLLSGLLAGFAAVAGNFLFNFIYREISGFSLSEVVNTPSIIFSSLLVGVAGGVVYFALRNANRRSIIYITVFLVLTFLGILADIGTHRTSDPVQQHDFRILFGGVILITGLCTAFLVPYFARHEKIFS